MADIIKNESFINDIKALINEAHQHVVRSVNTLMVITYWEIGRRIVEEEQNGSNRAEYGKYIIESLSKALTDEFGKDLEHLTFGISDSFM